MNEFGDPESFRVWMWRSKETGFPPASDIIDRLGVPHPDEEDE